MESRHPFLIAATVALTSDECSGLPPASHRYYQAFNREKKRAVMEAEDALTAQMEAMAERLKKQASKSLQQVWHIRQEQHRWVQPATVAPFAQEIVLSSCQMHLRGCEAASRDVLSSRQNHKISHWDIPPSVARARGRLC